MIKTLLSVAILGFSLTSHVAAYGNAGHQAVGKIATRYLEGTRAGKMVEALLKDEGLEKAATWADRAKLPASSLTPEMKSFIADNPEHHSYHYCDVPFQQAAYKLGASGTNPRDIVQVLRICIGVLQSKEEKPENSLKIDKRVALLLVAHFIGDLHQPLHVGCSYVDPENRYVDPDAGAAGQMDAGGNYLHISKSVTLHGYWDTTTVKLARDHAGEEDFSTFLVRIHPADPGWNGKGAPADWPDQWASESVKLAARCFEGIVPRDRRLVPKNAKREEHFEWSIKLPPAYAEKSRDIVELELSKAGYRLATLLKAVWPEGEE